MSSEKIGIINCLIGEVGFQIRFFPKIFQKHVNDLIARYNFISPVSYIKPTIILSIRTASKPPFNILEKAKLILRFRTYDFKIYKNGDSRFLTDNSNLLILHPGCRKGTLIITNAVDSNLSSVLDLFVTIAMIELLGQQDYLYLHAAGVAKNGLSLLLVSDNGQGKSTSALKLFFEGWKYLCDDFVFLRQDNKQQVKALSITSYLKLRVDNPVLKYKRFGVLQKVLSPITQDGLCHINMGLIGPDKIIREFIPNIILFLHLKNSRTSTLRPLKNKEVLPILIKQNRYVFFERKITNKRLELLFDLIAQTKSYILEIGRDIQEDKVRLPDLLSSLKAKSVKK